MNSDWDNRRQSLPTTDELLENERAFGVNRSTFSSLLSVRVCSFQAQKTEGNRGTGNNSPMCRVHLTGVGHQLVAYITKQRTHRSDQQGETRHDNSKRL